ncbi:hypothetical protein [Roseivivax marinus]|uniref:hypothetical protein n=1 Tax=Roseivivax marinus TaxID=1379903 RepID=UPI00273E37C5|nr:hypothetical protein [Roseivivax marinus]
MKDDGYQAKITQANTLRESSGDAILAALAVAEIRRIRVSENGISKGEDTQDAANLPLNATAYIIRQLKRPEEVSELKKVYGEKFVQISVALDENTRIANLIDKLGIDSPNLTPQQCEDEARRLVSIDNNEKGQKSGQRLSKIFHLADAFISGQNDETIRRTTDRFVEAFFGKNSIGPTKDEFGAYTAKAASLRSIDPARQVGAAILNSSGDIISVGCNEVPKYGGGNYWSDDQHPQRDMDKNSESNKVETKRIIHDFLERLEAKSLLKPGVSAEEMFQSTEFSEALDGALIEGITEYGIRTNDTR